MKHKLYMYDVYSGKLYLYRKCVAFHFFPQLPRKLCVIMIFWNLKLTKYFYWLPFSSFLFHIRWVKGAMLRQVDKCISQMNLSVLLKWIQQDMMKNSKCVSDLSKDLNSFLDTRTCIYYTTRQNRSCFRTLHTTTLY